MGGTYHDYQAIYRFAKRIFANLTFGRETGESIFITNKGEADGVYMSIEAYEAREKIRAHRATILATEAARLSGVPTYTQDELDARVEALLSGYSV